MSLAFRVRNTVLLSSILVMSAVTLPVMAADTAAPDYSSIVAGMDFASVVTGIISVATAIAGVYVAVRGAKMIVSFLRSA